MPPPVPPRATNPPEPSRPPPSTSPRPRNCLANPYKPVRSTAPRPAGGTSLPPPSVDPSDRSPTHGSPNRRPAKLSRYGCTRFAEARSRADGVGSPSAPRSPSTVPVAPVPQRRFDPSPRADRTGRASGRCPPRTPAPGRREAAARTTASGWMQPQPPLRRTNREEPPREPFGRRPWGFGSPSRTSKGILRLSTQGEVSRARVWRAGDAAVKGGGRERARGYFLAAASLAFLTSASARLRVEVTAMSAA